MVWDALALSTVGTLRALAVVAFFAVLGGIISGGDSAEVGTVTVFLICLVFWPFELGYLLHEGWGRVVPLTPISGRRRAWAFLLLSTILPVVAALVCSALVFLLLRMMHPVNWTLLLQWASVQYCGLSALFLLHAVGSADFFPGILTGRSQRPAGWRWGLTLTAHCLILIAILPMTKRVTEQDLSLASALVASGAIFSVLGAGRLRWITASPRAARHFRRLADDLPRERPPRLRSLLRRRWPRASRLFWLGLISRNTLIAMCLVLCWLLLESVPVLEGREHEVGWDSVLLWGFLLPLFCLWAIAPVVRALRAIRLLPCGSSGLGARLVSTSLGSIVICAGLLTLAVFLLTDWETAENCAPMIVAIAGTSSLVIPRYIYGGMVPALGVLMANCILAFYLIGIAEILSLEAFPDWLLPFGGMAALLSMIFTWRAAAKAQDSLRPLPGS